MEEEYECKSSKKRKYWKDYGMGYQTDCLGGNYHYYWLTFPLLYKYITYGTRTGRNAAHGK